MEPQLSEVVVLDPDDLTELPVHSTQYLELKEEQRGRIRITYRIRRGDSLRRIARRFGLSVGSIMRINQISPRAQLVPNEDLILYVSLKRAVRFRHLLAPADRRRLSRRLKATQHKSARPSESASVDRIQGAQDSPFEQARISFEADIG